MVQMRTHPLVYLIMIGLTLFTGSRIFADEPEKEREEETNEGSRATELAQSSETGHANTPTATRISVGGHPRSQRSME